jgi:EPS-associated MarR family transcriptional regulator|tara:strand:+ start:704 stop:1009 length:306 start_codon:yes stop_codon:yes gene_type:complete
MKNDKENLDVLINIQKNPIRNQRNLAKSLGFSLGKLNYIIKSLKQKGYIKVKNFQNNPKKMNYFYYLTPKGLTKKTKLAINYLNRLNKEYEKIQSEIKRQN